jgi:hypothetical protein
MNVGSNPNSVFPSQVVSDAEKDSFEYGEKVGKAVESEWLKKVVGVIDSLRTITTSIA